ncbi:MAG: beta-glucosidase [Gammaproteobacteria bacterium]|nr:beta-glucosidase [Gammaproteobacteria bacterium]
MIRRFPGDFTWGVATSAYQIEGAAHEGGRADSIWDEFCRRSGTILDASSGDVACDHYHRYEQDLDLLRTLNVDAYRFSISWPRVQPDGSGAWNETGFDFYDRLLDAMHRRGIAAHATLYHWDLPLSLQSTGGWHARETCARFADYAAEVARRFGDRLASVATINEPWVVAILGHESGRFAPGLRDRKLAMQVSHHLLLGHGLALRALRAERPRLPAGIVLNLSPIHPATDSADDLAKARIDDGLLTRWYLDPLLFGRYPADVLDHLGADAPLASPEDLRLIAQPLDFIGVNYYTRGVAATVPPAPVPDRNVTEMGWEVFPAGLTELLLRLRADYPLPPVYVMENGAAYRDVLVGDRVEDAARVAYLAAHVRALADAIDGGVDVRGYFIWSLLDNFEWADGYTKRFGLVYVDYPTQRRILKDSALWYRQFLAARARSGQARAS